MRNKEHARRVGGCHVSGARPSSDHFISCGRLYFQKSFTLRLLIYIRRSRARTNFKKVVAKLPMLGSYKHTDNHVITFNLKQLLPIKF